MRIEVGDITTVIDDCDAQIVSGLRLFVWRRGAECRVMAAGDRGGRGYCGPLGRFLLGFPDGQIDHINRDPLDNRRGNLRVVSAAQNQWNAGPKKNGRSKYRGVYYKPQKRRWIAQITHLGKHEQIGSFTDEREAAIAYNGRAKELRGDYAYLNQV